MSDQTWLCFYTEILLISRWTKQKIYLITCSFFCLFQGRELSASTPGGEEEYFRLHINQYNSVETITCRSRKVTKGYLLSSNPFPLADAFWLNSADTFWKHWQKKTLLMINNFSFSHKLKSFVYIKLTYYLLITFSSYLNPIFQCTSSLAWCNVVISVICVMYISMCLV